MMSSASPMASTEIDSKNSPSQTFDGRVRHIDISGIAIRKPSSAVPLTRKWSMAVAEWNAVDAGDSVT